MDGTYIGERPFISDFANAYGDQEDYYYLTAKLTYLLDKGSVYVTVKNLLNEKYTLDKAYLTPTSVVEFEFHTIRQTS